MNALPSEKTARPIGSFEFGTLMLLGLFAAPLVMHLLASLLA